MDKPADNAAIEAPEQRRQRVRARVREEKAKGTKAFLRRVADEEGISVSRLKQLTSGDPPLVGIWAGLTTGQTKGAGLKRIKPKH